MFFWFCLWLLFTWWTVHLYLYQRAFMCGIIQSEECNMIFPFVAPKLGLIVTFFWASFPIEALRQQGGSWMDAWCRSPLHLQVMVVAALISFTLYAGMLLSALLLLRRCRINL
jgi:hypothetical protein